MPTANDSKRLKSKTTGATEESTYDGEGMDCAKGGGGLEEIGKEREG